MPVVAYVNVLAAIRGGKQLSEIDNSFYPRIFMQAKDNISNFVDFLLNKGFTLTEDNKQLRFVTYQHQDFYVCIVSDPDGKRFVDLGITNLPGWQGWQDMNTVYFFVSRKHYSEDGPVYFDKLSRFFIDHYSEIRDAFKSSEYPKTEAVLTALKKESAKIRFGYEGPEKEEKPSWLTRLLKTFGR